VLLVRQEDARTRTFTELEPALCAHPPDGRTVEPAGERPVVAGADEPALALADCGPAVVPDGGSAPVPWHADLIAVDAATGLAALLGAVPPAGAVSRASTMFALAGSAASVLGGLPTRKRGGSLPLAGLGVDVAALAAQAHGHL
jgi:hypothetical protein